MTRKQFNKHFKAIQKILGLSHWRLNYDFDLDIEGTSARNTDRAFVYFRGDISFDKDFLKQDDDFIIETIIHEMLHCVLGFYDREIETIGALEIHGEQAITQSEMTYVKNSLIDKEEIIIATMSLGIKDLYLANLQLEKKSI